MVTRTASPSPVPWDSAAAHEQLFVLITGANSGIGLGTAQVLIDDFLATRSLTSHLILIPTTRSSSKSLSTIRELRSYAAKSSRDLVASRGTDAGWQDAVARIHILSLTLDLCDLRAVRDFALRLRHGTVSNPEGLEGEYLRNVRIPRLDSIVCNAAYGGWSGLSYPRALWSLLTKGIVQTATWPEFKLALPTCILNEMPEYNYPDKPLLGQVFCACVFGHYMLVHNLLPLLSRSWQDDTPPGRVIWSSSLEAIADKFRINDIQGFSRPEAYESAKRLTDLLSLSCSLHAARPYSSRFLTMDDDDDDEKAIGKRQHLVEPKFYLTHPGIVVSTLFPLPHFLLWLYELVLVLCRWLGSPWHNVSGYNGAKAAAWIALESQDYLDHVKAERVKWGSSMDASLRLAVKKTEVDGWGWEGRPETVDTIASDTAVGVLRKTVGRRIGVHDVTTADIVEFEEAGAQCWRQLEELRLRWQKELAMH